MQSKITFRTIFTSGWEFLYRCILKYLYLYVSNISWDIELVKQQDKMMMLEVFFIFLYVSQSGLAIEKENYNSSILFNATCTENNHCSSPHSFCQNGRCACMKEFESDVDGKCIPANDVTRFPHCSCNDGFIKVGYQCIKGKKKILLLKLKIIHKVTRLLR